MQRNVRPASFSTHSIVCAASWPAASAFLLPAEGVIPHIRQMVQHSTLRQYILHLRLRASPSGNCTHHWSLLQLTGLLQSSREPNSAMVTARSSRSTASSSTSSPLLAHSRQGHWCAIVCSSCSGAPQGTNRRRGSCPISCNQQRRHRLTLPFSDTVYWCICAWHRRRHGYRSPQQRCPTQETT